MEPIKLGDLFKNIGVTKKPDIEVSAVSTDSRAIEPGSVFVAIKGEKFDGEDFVPSAVRKGAAAIVATRRFRDLDVEQIIVPDTKDALIRMAGNYRDMFDPKVVGVTGSVGKTTTKEMIAAIFEQFGKTLKNEGNQNNEIGLPNTIFSMTKDTELAVLEMGMNGRGDISKLTRAAKPHAAVITMIGLSHIEFLKSKENILKAKLEIVEGLPEHGVLVINGDDEMLMRARETIDKEIATFAIRNLDSDVVAKDIITSNSGSEFTIYDRIGGTFKAFVPAVGEHNIRDAIAAYTIATRIGLDPAKSVKALENYRPAGMRQKVVPFNGMTVIEDCYNANPDSMRASLQMLSGLSVNGMKIAVLGDMLELGEISEEAHRSLGMYVAKCGIDVLLCYGREMKACAKSATAAGVPCVAHFSDKEELAKYLAKTANAGDAIVFKGSRGMMLEDIIHMFYEMKK